MAYSAFQLARLKVYPERFFIENVALQASVKDNLVSRVISTLGTISDWWLLCDNSTNQSLYSYVISMNCFLLARNFKRVSSGVNSACEEKCLFIYSNVLSLFKCLN